jgi:hypothetical protein
LLLAKLSLSPDSRRLAVMFTGSVAKCLYYVLGMLLLEKVLYCGSETKNTCSKSNINHTIGKKLPVLPIKSMYDIGPNACFKECQRVRSCLSVNYNTNHLFCELLDRTKSDIQPLISDEDFIHMELPDIVSKVHFGDV